MDEYLNTQFIQQLASRIRKLEDDNKILHARIEALVQERRAERIYKETTTGEEK